MSCNSYNTGTRALPDMFAQYSWAWASADISDNAKVPVLQLRCNTYSTLKSTFFSLLCLFT